MNIPRRLLLLAGTALALQVAGKTVEADDDLAAFVYWRLPLTGLSHDQATPTLGLSMLEAKNVWLTPSVKDGDSDFTLPALVDLRFSGGEEFKMPSLSLSGVDVGAVIDNALYADTGPAPHTGEWILIGAGVGLGGLIACAELCFDNNHHHVVDGGEGPPP